MKNLKYFPFERNKYFYGKLLSVDDFETEQKYMNDKRRMMNRFMHGTGVACGLHVVQVDDMTLSVEPGLALDFSGREIVIDQPVTKKLSMFEGFESYTEADEEQSYLYLCIEYMEKEVEAVHNLTGNNSGIGENMEYNKYAEGYRLFLTNQEPEAEEYSNDAYYEKETTIYWGNGVRIKQIMPRYVQSGQEVDLKIIVENMGQQQNIKLSYDLDLTCMQHKEKNWVKVEFDEELAQKSSRYELVYHLTASPVKNTKAIARVKENSFQISIGKKLLEVKGRGFSEAEVLKGNIKEEITKKYYENGMEQILKNSYQQSIYLAKISSIRAGNSYLIDSIEQMPFQQYVYNGVLGAVMNRITMKEIEKLRIQCQSESIERKDGGEEQGNVGNTPKIATGSVIFDLGIGGTTGQKFFTEQIAHGLGLGSVQISLGTAYTMRDKSPVIFGEPGVFEEKEQQVRCDLAAKMHPDTGTFEIGMKLKEITTASQVKIHWMAVKNPTEEAFDVDNRNIYIKPNMLYLKLKESYHFEASFTGITDTRLVWRVKEENGGTIDENGTYTAPNETGVFEVIGESVAYPEIRSSAFVVVRDI